MYSNKYMLVGGTALVLLFALTLTSALFHSAYAEEMVDRIVIGKSRTEESTFISLSEAKQKISESLAETIAQEKPDIPEERIDAILRARVDKFLELVEDNEDIFNQEQYAILESAVDEFNDQIDAIHEKNKTRGFSNNDDGAEVDFASKYVAASLGGDYHSVSLSDIPMSMNPETSAAVKIPVYPDRPDFFVEHLSIQSNEQSSKTQPDVVIDSGPFSYAYLVVMGSTPGSSLKITDGKNNTLQTVEFADPPFHMIVPVDLQNTDAIQLLYTSGPSNPAFLDISLIQSKFNINAASEEHDVIDLNPVSAEEDQKIRERGD